ncbi:thioredoxin family protein [Larkinella terrae]|uniref:Thioredoxin n=1 Tax=Larkinella terrae TaxID=2025311 RepID=A0A7K0EFP1_9BACT|nr:thioredoxin [Larkinella terrae]MRS60663.1 thioredoxin [Larkinella terrae]
METTLFRPLIVPAKTAVLLVFVPDSIPQQARVNQVLERVGAELGESIRITRVDEVVHPEVVLSFRIQRLPSFVLLKHGMEIWRYSGLLDAQELIGLLTVQLQEVKE